MTAIPIGQKTEAPDAAKQARNAAKQLEAFFLRQFLAEARPSTGSKDGGFAGDTFKDMFDNALADSMSASGGFGLTATFEKALGGTPEPIRSLSVMSDLGNPTAHAVPGRAAIPDLADLPVEGEMVRPAVGRFSSRFGTRTDPIDHTQKGHFGLDIAAREGTPVVAALDGKVKHAGPAGTYGNLITLAHADGTETRYAHLSAITVKVGQHVAAGTPMGAVGTTGRSTGPHLHFEVRRDGRPVDPWPLLNDAEKPGTP